jgi:tetratricopeptide (TPR) repeat protein
MRWIVLCMFCGSAVLAGEPAAGDKFMPKSGVRFFASDAVAETVNGQQDVVDLAMRLLRWKPKEKPPPSGAVSYPFVVREVRGDMLDIGFASVRIIDVVPIAQAPEYYTDLLTNSPSSTWAYYHRAMAWRALGHTDKAISDFREVTRLDPFAAGPIIGRGIARARKGDLDAAIEDFSEAIQLSPSAIAYSNRGSVRKDKGDYENALKDLDEAIRLDPNYATAYGNRAWLRATAKTAQYRNGPLAVADATRACELSGRKDPGKLDTLAAAFAQAGQFAEAMEAQQEAIAIADEEDKSAFEQRLHLYSEGKPYRE